MHGKFSRVKVIGAGLLAVALVLVLACAGAGAAGPAGPAGAPGPAGAAGAPGYQSPPACIEVMVSPPVGGNPIGALAGVGTDLGNPHLPKLSPGIQINWTVTVMGTGFTPRSAVEVVMVGACPPDEAYDARRSKANPEDYLLRMGGVLGDGSFKVEPSMGAGGSWGMMPGGLTPGVYTIKATDDKGIVATTPLLVLPPAAMKPPTGKTVVVAPPAPGNIGEPPEGMFRASLTLVYSGNRVSVLGAGFNPGTHPMFFVGDPPGPPAGQPAINPIKVEIVGVGEGGANYMLGMAFTGPNGVFNGGYPPSDVPAPPPPPGFWTIPATGGVVTTYVLVTELKSNQTVAYPIIIVDEAAEEAAAEEEAE